MGLAIKFTDSVNMLFNKVLVENEKIYFIFT